MSAAEDGAAKRKRAAAPRDANDAARPRARSPLREAQKEVARQRLVESARAAFAAKGYVDVTVDDIVQGAGASRGTFYLYFQSKREILLALIDQLRGEVVAAGDDFRAMGEPTVDALQAWFERYVDFYLDHRDLWRAMHQAQVVEPEFMAMVVAAIDRYVELWRSVRVAKAHRDVDLRLPATMMYTFVDQFMYLWLSQGQQVDREKTTRVLAEAVYAALMG
jgi:AcrR family transcriptional regulator